MKATKSLYTLPCLLLFPFIAHAGDVPGTYAKYQWDPSVTGLTSIGFTINVQANPGYRANVRFANQFHLVGSNNGGYVGMEDNSNLGPNFVFTVQGATQYTAGDPGSYCVVHSGNNPGVTCRLPYNWINTHDYQFHVAYEGGQWLGVTVTDLYSNPVQSFNLGSILTDATSISPLGMEGRTKYLEASSPNSNCYNQPYSDAIFTPPSSNGVQATVSKYGTNTTCADFSSALNWEQYNGGGNLLRGLYVGDDSLCVDAGDGHTVGVAATTQTCNKKKETQAWVLGKDGTMRLQSNLCLDVANADSPSGSGVIVDQCTGSASQQWTVGPGGNLLFSNLGSFQYCLTEGAAGTQLTVQECTGVGQGWSIPLLPVLP